MINRIDKNYYDNMIGELLIAVDIIVKTGCCRLDPLKILGQKYSGQSDFHYNEQDFHDIMHEVKLIYDRFL